MSVSTPSMRRPVLIVLSFSVSSWVWPGPLKRSCSCWNKCPLRFHLRRRPARDRKVRSDSLLEECDAGALNAYALHWVPARPSPDHHPQLPLPPAHGDHSPKRATDLGGAMEGLIDECRLDLADIG